MHESHGHQHTFLNLRRLLCTSHLPPLSFNTIHHSGTSLRWESVHIAGNVSSRIYSMSFPKWSM